MTYAVIPSLGDATVDVAAFIGGSSGGGNAMATAGAALSTQKDTLNQIVANTPGASDVASDWGPAVDIAGKAYQNWPAFQKDPGKAVTYGLQTIPTILNAAGIDGPAADIAAVAAGLAPQIGALVDGHPGPIVMAGIKSGAAYGCKALGIPPEYGTVTIDTVGNVIEYGEINNKTMAAAGGLGGAVGGSALCSLIGVPPCIGGYLGGIAGKALGGVIASAFGIGGGRQEREEKRKEWQAAAASYAGALDSMRSQYASLLAAMRGTWWAGFDSIVNTMSLQWTGLECNLAYARFPLLWSGQGAVNPFFLYPYSSSLCTLPLNRNLSRGTGCLNTKSLLANVTAKGCPEAYGCPYPSFPTLGADDQFSERVVQALAAYDIWWVPPPQRNAIDQLWLDSLPKSGDAPLDPTIRAHQRGEPWASWLADQSQAQKGCKSSACKNTFQTEINSTIDGYRASLEQTMKDALAFDGIQAALTRIVGDLCSTAGVYAAAAYINANQSALIKGNLSQAVAENAADQALIVQENHAFMNAVAHGKILNRAVNYSMLALGAGLFAGALVKSRRRR